MNTTSKILEYTTFVVFRDSELTNVYQKVLTHLYMPLVGPKSINIYTTLATLVDSSTNESLSIGHLKLFQMLKIEDPQDFIMERQKLEAVGLLEVYEGNQNYIYKLNQPLLPNDFFNNDLLNSFLLQVVGRDTYQGLLVEFLMHRFNLQEYQDITRSFDDVFKIDNLQRIDYTNELNTLITSSSGNQIKVRNAHFDYQYLVILLGALDILNKEILNSRDFYDKANRYSFIYQLTTEEIKDAAIASITASGEIDYDLFKQMCKLAYEKHPVKAQIKEVTQPTNNSRLITYLEQTAPTEIVKTMFGVGLVSSEIEMFDRLMDVTGISLGILNVLIIYVLKDKNGEIPSYNYFDKIVKTWQRMKITSVSQAMDYINGRTPSTKTKKRNTKSVPNWYDDYAKSIEDNQSTKSSKQSDDELNEIKELFKFEEK